MDPQLSKTGLGISLRPLVMILCQFEVWSKHPKKRGGARKKKSSQVLKNGKNHKNTQISKLSKVTS